MMYFLFVISAVFAGVLMPLQAAINAQLSRYLTHPLEAGLISFASGTVGLLLINLALRIPLSGLVSGFASAPWYLFLGGILGAFFVTSSIFLVTKLGAVSMTSLFIAGQFLGGILIDHYGLLGVPVRSITLAKGLGLLLLAAGVVLIRKSN